MAPPNPGVPGYTRSETVLASAAYKTNQAVTVTNLANRSLHVILDVTVKTGTPTNIILTIKGIDPVSGKKYTLLAGAAVTAVTTNVYKIFPASTVTANVSANDMLPPLVEVSIAGTGVDTDNYFTYSVGANWGT